MGRQKWVMFHRELADSNTVRVDTRWSLGGRENRAGMQHTYGTPDLFGLSMHT